MSTDTAINKTNSVRKIFHSSHESRHSITHLSLEAHLVPFGTMSAPAVIATDASIDPTIPRKTPGRLAFKFNLDLKYLGLVAKLTIVITFKTGQRRAQRGNNLVLLLFMNLIQDPSNLIRGQSFI